MESPEASATPDAEQSLIGGSGPSASPSAAAPPPLRTLYPLWAMAFFLNCKPSEPYLARFLMEAKNLTEDQLNHEVWPWSTWGSLLFLLPVGMLAEHVGYRRVILGGLVCREATRVLLLFTSSVFWMATMQLTYAGVMAVQPIFLAYAYVIVAPEHYALATGGVHGAYHAGNFFGSMLGELLEQTTSVGEGNLQVLFYLSWATTTLGLALFVLAVPPPRLRPPPSLFSLLREPDGLQRAAAEMRALYAPKEVRLASLWWVCGGAAMSLAFNIFQTYFYLIDADAPFGAIEGALEAIQAGGAALVALPTLAVVVTRRPAALLGGTAAAAAAGIALGCLAGGAGSALFWVVAPVTAAMGLNGAQEAIASAAIATAISRAAAAEGKGEGGGPAGAGEGGAGEEAGEQRFAMVFPLNLLASLLLASLLQLGCAEGGCESASYLWLSALGNAAAAAALALLS